MFFICCYIIIFHWGSWYFVNDLRIFEMTVESRSISSETLPVEKSLAIYDWYQWNSSEETVGIYIPLIFSGIPMNVLEFSGYHWNTLVYHWHSRCIFYGAVKQAYPITISIEGLRYRLITDSIDLNETALHILSHLGWLYFLFKSLLHLSMCCKPYYIYPVK